MIAIAVTPRLNVRSAADPAVPAAAAPAGGFDALLDKTGSNPGEVAPEGLPSPVDATPSGGDAGTTSQPSTTTTSPRKTYPITEPWAFRAGPSPDLSDGPSSAETSNSLTQDLAEVEADGPAITNAGSTAAQDAAVDPAPSATATAGAPSTAAPLALSATATAARPQPSGAANARSTQTVPSAPALSAPVPTVVDAPSQPAPAAPKATTASAPLNARGAARGAGSRGSLTANDPAPDATTLAAQLQAAATLQDVAAIQGAATQGVATPPPISDATAPVSGSSAPMQNAAFVAASLSQGDAVGNKLASSSDAAPIFGTGRVASSSDTAPIFDTSSPQGSNPPPTALRPSGDIVQGTIVGRTARVDESASASVGASGSTPPAFVDPEVAQPAPSVPADVGAAVASGAPKPLRNGAISLAAAAQAVDATTDETDATTDVDPADRPSVTQGAAPTHTLAATSPDGATATGAASPDKAVPDATALSSTPFMPALAAAHVGGAADADVSAGTAAPSASADAVTSDTVSSLASQTATLAGGGASQFQIELHPFGLGRVNVSVAIDSAGQVSAAFAFDKAQTADALGARSGELQKALEQAGFSLADAGLSFSVAHAANQASAQSAAQGQADGSTPRPPHVSQTSSQASHSFDTGAQGGQGFGQGARQNASTYAGLTGGRERAFAAAAETAVAADSSPTSTYASRTTAGVDVRI